MNGHRFVCLDIEATGVDPATDRIVELAIIVDGVVDFLERVNPGRPIPPGATEIHGIADMDVADRPPFSAYAPKVQEFVTGAVLVTYNGRKFDDLLLHRELRMAGMPGLETDEHDRIVQPEIDLFGIWRRLENRKLVTAAKRFAGVDLEDAHSAAADAEVLPRVLMGMLEAFDLDGAGVEQLCELSRHEGEVDRDGKFRRLEDGTVVFTIGRDTRDQPVHEHMGMLLWMLDRDFSADTKWWARKLYDECHATR